MKGKMKMSEITVKENLGVLAQTRKSIAELQNEIDKAKQELYQLPLAKMIDDLEGELKQTNEFADRISNEIRNDVHDYCVAYGFENRKPFSGIEIKRFTVVNITDETGAKRWASLNAPSMLSLSKKFNSMVADLEVLFKEVTEEYRIQISSKLDEYLE